jgi:hypothetical protein
MKIQLEQRFNTLSDFLTDACNRADDDQMGNQLRRLGAVLVCGYIERSVEIIIIERLKKKAQPQVLQFIKSHFKRGSNYHCAAIQELLQRFDSGWATKFETWMSENSEQVDGVKSIYSVRNSVAHGGTNNVGSASLLKYSLAAQAVIEELISATNKGSRR